MQHKNIGIFGKVFFYTMLILVLVIAVAALFFTQQITGVLRISQQQQASSFFAPLKTQLEQAVSDEHAVQIADEFHENNSSFNYRLLSSRGEVLYTTPDYPEIKLPPILPDPGQPVIGIPPMGDDGLANQPFFRGQDYQVLMNVGNGLSLQIVVSSSGAGLYSGFVQKTLFAVLLLLLAGGGCAFLFARSIAGPVRTLAEDTKKMSDLEPVSPPVSRGDEIGRMADDVYRMYEQLKETIRRLREEIAKQREMEQNQRYFFAAASHELKTPIAATGALLEGMLERVIPQGEYPGTLRECLKMTGEQSRLISEILEVNRLDSSDLSARLEPLNLSGAVAEILPAYLTLAHSGEISIKQDIPADLRCRLDRSLFNRALSNILLNAVQNTPPGGEIQIYCENRKNDLVRLSVLNKGECIPGDLLPRLFEPFYREDKARSRVQGRSGLGLTIVKKALNLMGVKFALENTAGGVVFWTDLQKCL